MIYLETESADNSTDLLLIEKYRDDEAVAWHVRQPHTARLAELKEAYVNDIILEKYKEEFQTGKEQRMKVIGINGSPRKTWNSAIVLSEALKGAEHEGAQTEQINLFDLKYSGCLSCFSCKRLGGKSFARCALKDDLTEVLEKIFAADAVIISAPIYYGDVPGTVRNFYERLLFPPNLYSADGSTGYSKRIPIGLIYTMGAPDPKFNGSRAESDKMPFEMFVGPVEILNVTDTCQFDDYSKYSSSMFDPEAKKKRREEVFPEDCKKAFELGRKMVRGRYL